MLEFSTYHKILRISSLSLAFVLLFQSGIISQTTANLTSNTQTYLANVVGVTVGVAPTELNQVTAELTKKSTELSAREEALREREIAVGLSSEQSSSQNRSTFILGTILFILLILIVLNYTLDFVRARYPVTENYVSKKTQSS
jgi:hypothetical protein